jgi:protein-S-isoprenylcysteine O-methyltransferase Ste14
MNISNKQKIFGIGPCGIAISLAILSFLWLFDRFLGGVELLNQPRLLRVAGGSLIGIWIFWHVWVINTLRSWLFGDQLCETGAFRLVRHPMYGGAIFLLFPGVALVLNSWILLLWPVISYPVWAALVQKEEKLMTEIFGERYTVYAARTGRFFPVLGILFFGADGM